MQSAEAFLHDYLRDRTKVTREQWAIYVPHVKRFFASDYEPWDRDKAIEGLESEKIASINTTDKSAEIVTTSVNFGLTQHTRYRLSVTETNSWRISSMENACCLCHGSGKEGSRECNICKGKGWNLIGKIRAN